MNFAHLHCHSPYSFLDGGSSIRKLLRRASSEGMTALALTDHDNVCGAVEFFRAAKELGIKPIQGAEITLRGGYHLTLIARNPRGYARICGLLTKSHLEGKRREPAANLWDLGGGEDLFVLSGCRRGEIPSKLLIGDRDGAEKAMKCHLELFGDSLFLEMQPPVLPGDTYLHKELLDMGERLGVRPVATANVHYAHKADFPIHDLLTCVRRGITISEVSSERHLNAENYVKSPAQMARHFEHVPAAVKNAGRIADECSPALDLDAKRFPRFPLGDDEDAPTALRRLAFSGARWRYGHCGPDITRRLERELEVIISMGYADYFLLVEDVVRFARREGIRFSGRGSAADSAVAYCLGITNVDALRRGLLFERFMSPERGERPDIDVDFDARYRDRVADYVRDKYGEDRVASVATFNTFRARSAVRELGKVMEFDSGDIADFARRLPRGSGAEDIASFVDCLPELGRRFGNWKGYKRLISAAVAVAGFPRHISTHCGGLVISESPLEEVTPLQWSAKGQMICQFDKEGVEDLGLVKLDLLSLRMLSAVDDATSDISGGRGDFDYDDIPLDDDATYAMLRRGETLGVFQLESPAQRALQARLGAENLEDVIASVALIRPGPIKGNMVDPYISRRHGEEEVDYIHPGLKPILEKTYGVVLFQEQVIEIAVAIAGFTPGEADRLRRVMSRSHPGEEMEGLGRLFVERARDRGVDEDVAETVYSYIRGYASYGFCEAHAAAFGDTAYRSAYLAQHYPAHFFAALLSNWPMGYYPPNTICIEARRRGVDVLGPDVNISSHRFTVEGGGIRVSLARVKGLGEESLEKILRARSRGGFASVGDFADRTGVDRNLLENLVLCGAFSSFCDNRRRLLWSLTPSRRGNAAIKGAREVPDFTDAEKVELERALLGIEVSGSRMGFLRSSLSRRGVITVDEVRNADEGQEVLLAGSVVCPHRPPTRSGKKVVFLSLEDETGLADVVVFYDTYRKYGHLIFPHSQEPILVGGHVQRRGESAGIVAGFLAPLGG